MNPRNCLTGDRTMTTKTPIFDALSPEGQRNAEAMHLAAVNEGQYYALHIAAARQELVAGQSPAFRRVISALVCQGLRNPDDSRPTISEVQAAAELSRAYYRRHVLESDAADAAALAGGAQ